MAGNTSGGKDRGNEKSDLAKRNHSCSSFQPQVLAGHADDDCRPRRPRRELSVATLATTRSTAFPTGFRCPRSRV